MSQVHATWDIPLYLLTSHRTFSAAEECTYNLQQLKRALVVGERTRGGAHAGLRYPIHAHFEAFIPNRRAINPISGTNWEGVGVQPDLPVAQEEAFDIAYQRALAETQ
jgi:C-terminal processing protease CtpA/Prc